MNDIERIENFLDERANICEASRKTYHQVLKRFYRYLRNNAIDYQNIGLRHLHDYARTFDNLSDLTKYGHFNVLKIHFKWLEENGLHLNKLKDGHPLARQPRRYGTFRKKPLTPEQLSSLLELPNQNTTTGLRDYALLHLLAFNGLRVVEVLRANFADTTGDGNGLYIMRKGSTRKDELIRLAQPVQQALSLYLGARYPVGNNQPLIASHQNGKTGRLTQPSVSRIVKEYLRKIGLDEKYFTAHSLRHTAAHILLRAGSTPNDLQRFLGHRNFATSQIYLQAMENERIYDLDLGQKIADVLKARKQSYNFITSPKEG